MNLLVVVVTFRSAADLPRLLDSLPAGLEGVGEDVRTRVVVVDNDSSDGTAELARERGDCDVVEQPNLGYAAGINTGVRTAPEADRILVLNPDAVVARGAVAPLLAVAARPGVGIVVPLLRDDDGTVQHSLRREPTLLRATGLGFTGAAPLSERVTGDAAYRTAHRVSWATGAAMLVTRECHEALRGWDESFFLYSEETDLCLRAADAGFETWFTPHAEVRHAGGGSGRDDLTHTLQIVNKVRLYGRAHRAPLATVYQMVTVASELTWWARGHSRSRAAIAALLSPRRRPSVLALAPGWLVR